MAEYFIGDPKLVLNEETIDMLKLKVETGKVIRDTFNGIYIQAYKHDHVLSHKIYDKNGKKLGYFNTIDFDNTLAIISMSACHYENDSDWLYITINSSKEPYLTHNNLEGLRIEFDDNVARIGK